MKCITQIVLNLVCGIVSGMVVSGFIMPKLEEAQYLNAVLLSTIDSKDIPYKDIEPMLEWGIKNEVSPNQLFDRYSKEHRDLDSDAH